MRKTFLLFAFLLFGLNGAVLSQTADRGVGNVKTERKIALVIGNTNYDNSIGRLTNPVNDASDMANSLQRLGFTIISGKAQTDVNRRRMLELIREFGQQIKQGGIGFFYFSGHGVQVNKENYIIPITDALVYEDDAETEAVKVDMVAKEMELAGNRLNILVLDACRNNGLQKRTRNTDKGLTEPARKPEGTFIAFSAGDGQTASDGTGKNGLFTQELLKNLETPNVRLDDIFRITRNEVKRLSDGRQIPILYDSTSEAFTLGRKQSELIISGLAVDDSKKAIQNAANKTTVAAWSRFRETANRLLKYDEIWLSLDDSAMVRTGSKWGFIDRAGKEIIAPKYDFARPFAEEVAPVLIQGKWGFVDKTGREIVAPKYQDAWSFAEGLAPVESAGKYGFIDKTGRAIIAYEHNSAYPFAEGLAPVEIGGKFGFIDKTGKEIIAPRFDLAFSFFDGLAPVESGGRWGFIDKTGRQVITLKYDYAYSFSDGLARVKSGGKWGFLDKTGREVIRPRYDEAWFFVNGLAIVKNGDGWGIIDKTGREIVPAKYESVWCRAFIKEGFIGVMLNGKKGFADLSGNEYFDF